MVEAGYGCVCHDGHALVYWFSGVVEDSREDVRYLLDLKLVGERGNHLRIVVWCTAKSKAGHAMLAAADYYVCSIWEACHTRHHSPRGLVQSSVSESTVNSYKTMRIDVPSVLLSRLDSRLPVA